MPTEIVVHATHQGGMHVVADTGEHRALAQAEPLVCPVWAMLEAGTPITASVRLVEGYARNARTGGSAHARLDSARATPYVRPSP
jgi:hypothetical protein